MNLPEKKKGKTHFCPVEGPEMVAQVFFASSLSVLVTFELEDGILPHEDTNMSINNAIKYGDFFLVMIVCSCFTLE